MNSHILGGIGAWAEEEREAPGEANTGQGYTGAIQREASSLLSLKIHHGGQYSRGWGERGEGATGTTPSSRYVYS
jgi:hypothetical protein